MINPHELQQTGLLTRISINISKLNDVLVEVNDQINVFFIRNIQPYIL